MTQSDPLDAATERGEPTYSRHLQSDGDIPMQRTRLSRRQKAKLTHREIAMPVDSPKSLYLEAEINKTSAMCLVDTGCSRCLISESLYQRLLRKPELSNTKFKFLMAQSSMEAKGVCHLEVSFAGRNFSQFFFVVPMTNFDVILGLDFMTRYNMGLLPADMTLFFDNVSVPLQRSKYFTSMAVRLNKQIMLKKFETRCIDVYGNPCLRNLDAVDNTLFCTAAEELWSDHGCVVYDGVVERGRNNKYQLYIHNPTPSDVTIFQDSVVGYMDTYKSTMDLPTSNPNTKYGPLTDQERHVLMAMESTCEEILKENNEFDEELDVVTPPSSQDSPPQDLFSRDMIKTMLASCKETLSSAEYQEAEDLIHEFSDRFRAPDAKLSRTDAVEHFIETKEGHEKPIRDPPRKVAMGKKEFVEHQIDEMLRDEIIAHSKSPWASPIVLVSKKCGATRFCVDYRKLNMATKLDAYPLPKIDDCIDAMQGAKYFCTLDLASGYWQVKMADRDREKTAFTSHVGLFEFNVMPFGLCNAPATFQRMMDRALNGLIHKICLVYIDDIIVYGKTISDLMENLRIVLSRLRDYNLLLKPKKCNFFQTSVDFLGHVISGEGVRCDPMKCDKISAWETPNSLGDVRSFLGLVGYYRRFIDDYSNKAKPLLQLSRKDVLFKWGPAHEEAFQSLKTALCSDPILAYPVDGLPWIIDTDASNYAVGAVLSQRHPDGRERVVCYGSKVLTASQQNYCTTKRELFAVIYFVTVKYATYLANRPFQLRTDHLALKWLMASVSSDAMCNRWIMKLMPFYELMKIEHRAGSKHNNADTMSRILTRRTCDRDDCEDCKARMARRQVDASSESILKAGAAFANDMDLSADSAGPIPEDLKKRFERAYVAAASQAEADDDSDITNYTLPRYSEKDFVAAQTSDDAIARMKELLLEHPDGRPHAKLLRGEVEEVKKYWKVWDDLRVERNILYRKDPNSPELRFVIPKSMRKEILEEIHNKPCGGHLGMTRIRAAIKRRFFWPLMRADIERWCRCCRTCSLSKKGPSRGKSPLIQELTSSVWERVAFDIIGPLKTTERGNRFILTVVDYFSKWVEAYPLTEHTAKTVAWTIVTEWVSRYGVPLHLHCDQAPEFESKVMADFCKMLGVTKTRTSPYHPICNGLAERCNQTLESILKCTVNSDKDNWDLLLPFALMAYRATPSATTGCSPNLLVHGRETTLPIDIMYGGIAPPERRHGVVKCYCEYVHDMQESMAGAFQRARACSKVAADRYKRHYDVGTAFKKFYPGQFVLWMHKPTANKTLHSGWRPLVVTRVLNKVDVQCQESERSRPITIHMDNLIPDPYKPERHNWVKEALIRSQSPRAAPNPVPANLGGGESSSDPIPVPAAPQQPARRPADDVNVRTGPADGPVAEIDPVNHPVVNDHVDNEEEDEIGDDSNDKAVDEQLSTEVSPEPAKRSSEIIHKDSTSPKQLSWKAPLESVRTIPKVVEKPKVVKRTSSGRPTVPPVRYGDATWWL